MVVIAPERILGQLPDPSQLMLSLHELCLRVRFSIELQDLLEIHKDFSMHQ